MAILQGARITGSIIATQFIKATSFSGSLTASRLYVQGSVGIGTSTPGQKLHLYNGNLYIQGTQGFNAAVNYTSFSRLIFNNDYSNTTNRGPNKITLYDDGSSWYGGFGIHDDIIGYYSGGNHVWYKTTGQTTSNEYMRLNSSGNLGIGTSSPSTMLQVVGTGVGSVGTINIKGSQAHLGFTTAGGTFKGWTGYFNSATHGSDLDLNIKTGYAGASNIRIGSTGDTTQVFISGSGNVGIGTTSPVAKLEPYGTGWTSNAAGSGLLRLNGTDNYPTITFAQSSTPKWSMYVGGAGSWIGNGNIGIVSHFGTEDATRVKLTVISGSGNVGIGTTSPTQKLEVAGFVMGGTTYRTSIGASGAGAYIYFGDTSNLYSIGRMGGYNSLFNISSFNGPISFQISDSEKVRIDSNGNLGIGTTSPYSKLTVSVPATNTISTADSSNTAGLTISGTGNLVRLQFGVGSNTLGPYGGWIQASYDNTGGNNGIEPLLLNPSGGNVGIGTSSPSQLVEAYKSSNSDIVFKITNPSTGSVATAQYYASNGTTQSQFFHTGTNFAGAGVLNYAGLGGIYNSATGISLAATNASGVILFGTGTSATERMRIASNGNVGIGTTSPASLLQVGGSTGATATPTAIQLDNTFRNGVGGNTSLKFYLYRNSGETYGFGLNNAAGIEYHAGSSAGSTAYHAFYTETSEKVRINTSGNVGIGTTSPSVKLHVVGSSILANATTINPDSYTGTIVAGNIADGSGWGVTGIGLNGGAAGRTLGIGNSGTDFYFGASNGSSATSLQTYIQFSGPTRNVFLVPTSGNVGIGTTSPTATLTVIATNNTGSRIQLGTVSTSTYMDANKVNDFMVLTAPYGASPASVSNGGAKWGIKMNGSIDSINIKGKSACVYAVSEENSAGYNRMVGLALHTSGFDLDNAERMRITNSGNVGIGTSVPVAYSGYTSLTIGGPSTIGLIKLRSSYNSGDGAEIYQNGSGHLLFNINSTTTPLYIKVDGNVGIGTTSPSQLLEVAGSSPIIRVLATSGNSTLRLTDNGVRNWDLKVVDTSDYFEVGGTNTTSLIVTGTGNVGIGDRVPSYKLDVSGSVRIYGAPSNGGLIFRGSSSTQGNIRPSVGNGTVLISDDSGGATRGMTVNNNGGITVSTANASQNIIEGQANGSQVMCLNYNGNIGLGTSSPAAKLHVVGDAILNGLKSIQLDRTVAAAVNSYTNIGSFDIINGAHSFIVSINASLSGYSVAKTYVIANQYNATSGNWKIALPITDSGPYNDDFQLLVNFDTRYCSLRIRKSSGSTYSGAYSVTILYTGYTSATFTSDTNTGTDSSVLGILDSNVLTQVDGSVGIGTTSPTNKLHVSGSSTNLPLKLEGLTSNATGYFLTVDNTTGVVYKSTGGANGTSGTSGANGSPGSPGSSGTNGTSGTSGANGSPGTSGTSGANGSPGSSGATGTSGSSGSSVGGSPVRAYVYFNGTGTVTINGSNNVTSITDNGVGDYTVNFTTAFVDAYYTVAGTCTLDFTNASSLYNVGLFVPRQANAQVAGSCRLACEYYNNTLYDCVAVRAEFVRA